MDRVSICLLTYNHAHVIDSAIDTILAQTFRDYELIISDDCSHDGTWEKLKHTETRDPRVRAIRPSQNLGMAANANFAVAESTGEYIALLHHDDLYRSDLIEKWVGALDSDPNAGFVFNAYRDPQSGPYPTDPMLLESMDGTYLLEKVLFPHWGCPIRGTAMIRRSAWFAVGGMRVKFGMLADVDLWMRLARMGRVAYVAEPLITVRHDRPADYPDDYKTARWSWRRQVLLYSIHGCNREEHFRIGSTRRFFALQWFRVRLSAETLKWFGYALVRRKWKMLERAAESRTRYDMLPLKLFRPLAVTIGRVFGG